MKSWSNKLEFVAKQYRGKEHGLKHRVSLTFEQTTNIRLYYFYYDSAQCLQHRNKILLNLLSRQFLVLNDHCGALFISWVNQWTPQHSLNILREQSHLNTFLYLNEKYFNWNSDRQPLKPVHGYIYMQKCDLFSYSRFKVIITDPKSSFMFTIFAYV